MDIFKLVGSIFIKSDSANKEIDTVANNAENMATKVGNSMKNAGDKITNVGKALTPLSLATGALLTASVKGASDFEDGMAKMSTLFDTTQTSVEDLSKEFITLSNETGISATELAEAGYQALSAGQNVDQVSQFVNTAGRLAKAGFTSTSTAVDVLTTSLNAYNGTCGTADEVANKLVRTQNLGKTTVDELASSMGKIIPTASSMNVDIDNLTSGYVSLTKQGIATAEATTYMNSMLNELGDSGTVLGGVLQEKTGKSFQELMDEGYSLADVLQITKDYADENGVAYNELWGSAEAGKAGLAILNGGVEEFNSTVETMASDTDDVGDALEKLETPSVKAKESLNQLKNSGIELGTSLLVSLAPTIEKVCGVIEKLTTWFSNLDPRTKTMISTILMVVTALAPVLMVVGKIIGVIGTLIPVISTLIGAVSGVIGFIQFLIPMMGVLIPVFLPVIAIIGAIVGAIIAVIVIIRHWGQITEWFKGVWESLKNKVSEVWNAIKTVITAVLNAIKTIITTVWNAIKTVILTIVNAIRIIITTQWNIIKTIVTTVVNAIRTVITSVFNGIKTVVTTILNGIKTVFSNIWNGIKNTVGTALSNIKSKITSGLSGALSTVGSKMSAIRDKFGSTMESAKNKVKSAIDKIKGFFNFSWSLPKIKLPHFSKSGKFSLNPPSVPHFSVSWYKKAMEDPVLFTKPTVFDMNPVTGKAKGAGEAGDEMMYGHRNLMNDIREASGNANLANVFDDWMGRMFDLFLQYFPQFANMQMVTDTGALVGELAPAMDKQLGIITNHKGRGN